MTCISGIILTFFRKQCINETEEFDFLKDIVVNVEDTPNTISFQNEEVKSSNEVKDIEISSIQENHLEDDDISKTQNHKCSISTILNDDPVTPPLNRTKDVEFDELNEPADSNLNEATSL